MYIIDTNIHIAYLLQNFETDPLTKKYITAYNKINLQDRVITDFVLGELETFMMKVVPSRSNLNINDRQTLKDFTLDYIQTIANEGTLVGVDTVVIQKAKDIFFASAKSGYLSFFDCLILATAQINNYTFLSRDEKLIAKAKALEITVFEV